jgi:hypothetical protein
MRPRLARPSAMLSRQCGSVARCHARRRHNADRAFRRSRVEDDPEVVSDLCSVEVRLDHEVLPIWSFDRKMNVSVSTLWSLKVPFSASSGSNLLRRSLGLACA